MSDYTGVKCPICERPFRENDDIVVCPECGAPYHRGCYQQTGRCIFEDLHQQGKEWRPPDPPKAPDPAAEVKDRECPVCGTLNGRSALFCSRCGTSLVGDPQRYNNSSGAYGSGGGRAQAQQPQQPPPWTSTGAPRTPYGAPVPPFAYDPMGGVSPADILDEGVTFGDASKLVKQNTSYYMPVFRYIKQSGRNKFNFSAFLFSGAWLLYRKQYKAGILVTALMALLYTLHLCALWLVAYPTMISLYTQAGIDITQEDLILTSEQYTALSSALMADSGNALRIIMPYLILGLILIVMIVVGIRGNKMYLAHCVKTVRMVRGQGVEADPTMTLDNRGGVSVPAALCVAVGYVLLRSLLPMLLI